MAVGLTIHYRSGVGYAYAVWVLNMKKTEIIEHVVLVTFTVAALVVIGWLVRWAILNPPQP